MKLLCCVTLLQSAKFLFLSVQFKFHFNILWGVANAIYMTFQLVNQSFCFRNVAVQTLFYSSVPPLSLCFIKVLRCSVCCWWMVCFSGCSCSVFIVQRRVLKVRESLFLSQRPLTSQRFSKAPSLSCYYYGFPNKGRQRQPTTLYACMCVVSKDARAQEHNWSSACFVLDADMPTWRLNKLNLQDLLG